MLWGLGVVVWLALGQDSGQLEWRVMQGEDWMAEGLGGMAQAQGGG